MSARFAGTVASALAAASFDPASLTLEVTEGIFLRDSRRAQIVLDELKAIGVGVPWTTLGPVTPRSAASRIEALICA
jgi:EAL domain-containing protein (putative c-di-GMP-specific phosphodiesterase class I)